MRAEHLFVARTPYATRSYGDFDLLATDHGCVGGRGGQDLVLVKGSVAGRSKVLCRITSRCITSTAFDAYDCDCAEQTKLAMSLLQANGSGILVYLDQEGRGHGLPTKIQAMRLKARGYDTFSAFEEMGLSPDVTDYTKIPDILEELEIVSIRLITNNPHKRQSLELLGVVVEELIPCVPESVPSGALRHLEAKKGRGHIIDLGGDTNVV